MVFVGFYGGFYLSVVVLWCLSFSPFFGALATIMLRKKYLQINRIIRSLESGSARTGNASQKDGFKAKTESTVSVHIFPSCFLFFPIDQVFYWCQLPSHFHFLFQVRNFSTSAAA